MTVQGVVRNGVVVLPTGTTFPDGTVVRVEATRDLRFKDLLELAGTWEGDDADAIVDEIYALRTSAAARVPLDP